MGTLAELRFSYLVHCYIQYFKEVKQNLSINMKIFNILYFFVLWSYIEGSEDEKVSKLKKKRKKK